jgi:hypothetical protein
MTESPAVRTPVQIRSPRVVGALYGLFRNLEIHDEDNQLFDRLTLEVVEALRSFEAEVGETFTLQMYGQELVVCGRLLRLDDVAFERAGKLGELLVRAGIGGLRMSGTAARDDLLRFCGDLSGCLTGGGPQLTAGGYGEILFATLEEDPSTALEARPEQLALWLFATLLDLCAELAEARAAGRRPSLLPLKRVLQRISEAAREHGSVFQLLPTLRNYSDPLAVPHRAVVESLTAMGFGIRLGLCRAELLANSIAAILCRLAADRGNAVAELLSYRGLGELGPAVVLAADDLARPSPAAGLPGQLLSLVRAYEEALVPGGDALAPADAVARITNAPPRGVEAELARMFANWLGQEPIGSPVELDDGQIALVFGPSAHDPTRSRVAILQSGKRIGQEIDLGAAGAPSVRRSPTPASLKLDLTQVRAS